MQQINGNWCASQMSAYDTSSNGIEKGLASATSTTGTAKTRIRRVIVSNFGAVRK